MRTATEPPPSAVASVQRRLPELVRGRYAGLNHNHLADLLSEREGITRALDRRLW